MKKIIANVAMLALLVMPFSLALPALAATAPNWNATGTYVLDMNYQGSSNPHDVSLTQDSSGNLTGNGGSPAGANTYTWVITSGSVSGDTITFDANYTATADAVTPQTVLQVTGTIAPDGTISGTWSDNYQGGSRTGTVSTISGNAVSIVPSLQAQDFGVMNQSGVKGYTAGFGLTNATFAGATSVVTQLYSGTTLLQTDTLSGPNASTITGAQISSPFDVFGTFNYVTDGYWTNVRQAEYGQTLIPTSVVATVTLASGQVVTATNTNLTGDPTTIFPPVTGSTVTTDSATDITMSDATLNATNGSTDATGHSFWVSLAPFATSSPTLPTGVYSTTDLGAIAANTSFSALLSSVVGLPTITPNTTYYFAAWTNVGGTWSPGAIQSFTTASTSAGTIGGTVTGGTSGEGTLAVTGITATQTTATADNTFADGWSYTFDITVPTNEPNLAMQFADWLNTTASNTLPTANNMEISSAQADNSGAEVPITAANTYASPALHITGDLDPSTPGMQVQVTVQVKIPTDSVNGAYTTSYGVQTLP